MSSLSNQNKVNINKLSSEFKSLYLKYKKTYQIKQNQPNKTEELLFNARTFKSSKLYSSPIENIKKYNIDIYNALLNRDIDKIHIGERRDLSSIDLKEYLNHNDYLEKIRIISKNPLLLNGKTEKKKYFQIKNQIKDNKNRYYNDNHCILIDEDEHNNKSRRIINNKSLSNNSILSSIIDNTLSLKSSRSKTSSRILDQLNSIILKGDLNNRSINISKVNGNIQDSTRQKEKELHILKEEDEKEEKKEGIVYLNKRLEDIRKDGKNIENIFYKKIDLWNMKRVLFKKEYYELKQSKFT